MWACDCVSALQEQAGVLVQETGAVGAEQSRGELQSEPGVPLCSMPAPGPELIQHIMSKLLLAAAPIETLIKAIRGGAGRGWGWTGMWRLVTLTLLEETQP